MNLNPLFSDIGTSREEVVLYILKATMGRSVITVMRHIMLYYVGIQLCDILCYIPHNPKNTFYLFFLYWMSDEMNQICMRFIFRRKNLMRIKKNCIATNFCIFAVTFSLDFCQAYIGRVHNDLLELLTCSEGLLGFIYKNEISFNKPRGWGQENYCKWNTQVC